MNLSTFCSSDSLIPRSKSMLKSTTVPPCNSNLPSTSKTKFNLQRYQPKSLIPMAREHAFSMPDNEDDEMDISDFHDTPETEHNENLVNKNLSGNTNKTETQTVKELDTTEYELMHEEISSYAAVTSFEEIKKMCTNLNKTLHLIYQLNKESVFGSVTMGEMFKVLKTNIDNEKAGFLMKLMEHEIRCTYNGLKYYKLKLGEENLAKMPVVPIEMQNGVILRIFVTSDPISDSFRNSDIKRHAVKYFAVAAKIYDSFHQFLNRTVMLAFVQSFNEEVISTIVKRVEGQLKTFNEIRLILPKELKKKLSLWDVIMLPSMDFDKVLIPINPTISEMDLFIFKSETNGMDALFKNINRTITIEENTVYDYNLPIQFTSLLVPLDINHFNDEVTEIDTNEVYKITFRFKNCTNKNINVTVADGSFNFVSTKKFVLIPTKEFQIYAEGLLSKEKNNGVVLECMVSVETTFRFAVNFTPVTKNSNK